MHTHSGTHTHAHTLAHTHAYTHTHTHTHIHTQAGTRAACTHRYRQVNKKCGGGGRGAVWLAAETKKFRSLVHGLRGIVWFWVEFWTGILLHISSIAYRVWEFIPCDRARVGKIALPLELFLSFWNPKGEGISRGTHLTGCDVLVKQVRQVRLGSFWDADVYVPDLKLTIRFT